jgi:hypothetical protein
MYDDAGLGADDGPEPGGGLGRLGHDTRRTDGSPAHRCVPNMRIFNFVEFLQFLDTLFCQQCCGSGMFTPDPGS